MPAHSPSQRLKDKRQGIMKKLQDQGIFDHVRRHATEVELPMIEAALARIADGDYDTCIDCGNPIESTRLEAIPEIDTCKQCGLSGNSDAS